MHSRRLRSGGGRYQGLMTLVVVADMGRSEDQCRTLADCQASACWEMESEHWDTGQARVSAQERQILLKSTSIVGVRGLLPRAHRIQATHDDL